MPSLSRASLGDIIIGNDRMQPCNFPSFEKKLRVSQTRMIAAINLLAAVGCGIHIKSQDWNLSGKDGGRTRRRA